MDKDVYKVAESTRIPYGSNHMLSMTKIRDESAKCKLCGWFNRMSADDKTCKNCREKALSEAIDLSIHIDEYIDGLIVTRELSEDHKLPGYEVRLEVTKLGKGFNEAGECERFTMKRVHASKTSSCDNDKKQD